VVVDRLTQQRATVADDKLAAAAEVDASAAQTAAGRVAELAEQLAAAAPDAITAELTDSVEAAAVLRERHDEIARTPARDRRAAHGFRHRRPQGKARRRRDPV